jgi:hypothetical protein
MILDFNCENAKKKFEFVHDGFLLGGSMVQTKGLTVMRREMDILNKLESISHPKPCGKKLPTDEPARALNDEGNLVIHIDAPQFDILFSYITMVPWKTGAPLRDALETIDWLAACQRMGEV